MKTESGPRGTDHPGEDDAELNVRQRHEFPESIRSLAVTDPDYADLFTLETGDALEWSPEQWARAAFEEVVGLKGQFIFRVLLGLRLERSSPDHVAGWPIAHRDSNQIKLQAHSRNLTANLIFEVDGDGASLATFMRYHRSKAERQWGRLSPRHRGMAPGLLRKVHAVLRSKPR